MKMKNRVGRSMQDVLVNPDPVADITELLIPCPPNHPYLIAHGLQGATAHLYAGELMIEDVAYHNAVALPLYDANGIERHVQLIVERGGQAFNNTIVGNGDLDGCFARIGTPDDTVLVAVDWPSAMSAHLATGHAVAVAIRDDNLVAVCERIAAKYPSKKLIICGYAGCLDHALPINSIPALAAKKTGALLSIPGHHAGEPDEDFTINTLHCEAGLEAVKACIESASPVVKVDAPTTIEEEVEQLAGLSPIEYEQQRIKSAKKFSVRASFLDKLVAEASEKLTAMAMLPIAPQFEPHPEPVDGPELFQTLVYTIRRFAVVTPSAATAIALWIIMSYLIGFIQVAPILGLVSPVKRCGKTTILTLLDRLCFRPISTANITAAALFRCIQDLRPTLLIDEADTFIHRSDELNGIVNSGHTRSTAFVYRVVEGVTKQFSTFCAKAIAVIGRLPETMFDRTIMVLLRRKRESEETESLRHASAEEFDVLRAQIYRWASDNADKIAAARPVLQGVANDRAVDNWEPLLAIASCLGAECATNAMEAAIELSATHAESKSLSEELLADIREAFRTAHAAQLSTDQLIGRISADEEKPWATYQGGKRITPRQLSGLLSTFDISSKNLRMGPVTVVKGYQRADFADAFARYLGSKIS